jgi:hypothetical protein
MSDRQEGGRDLDRQCGLTNEVGVAPLVPVLDPENNLPRAPRRSAGGGCSNAHHPETAKSTNT